MFKYKLKIKILLNLIMLTFIKTEKQEDEEQVDDKE